MHGCTHTHPCCHACTRTRGHRLSIIYGLQASKPSTPRQGIEAWRTPRPTPRPTAGGEEAGTGDDPTTAPPPPLPEPPPPPPLPAPPPPPGQPPTLLNATAFLPQPDLPMPPTPLTPTLSPRGKSHRRRATQGQQALSGGRQSHSPVRPPSADGWERGASPGRRESLPGPWDGEAPSPGNRLSFPSEYVGLVNRPSSGARGSRPKSATRPGSAPRSQVPPTAQRGGLTLSLPVAQPVAPHAYSSPRKGSPPSPENLSRQRRLSRPMGACRSRAAASPRQGPRLHRLRARPVAALGGSVLPAGEVSWAPSHRRGCAGTPPPVSPMAPPFFDHCRPNAPPREAGWDQRPASANFATYRPSHAPAPPLSPPLENLPRAPRARDLRAERWVADRREAPHRREPLRTRGGSGGSGGGGGRRGGGCRDWQELLDEGTGGARQAGFQPTRRPRSIARVTLSVADVGPGHGGPFASSARHVPTGPMRGSQMLGFHYE